MLSRLRHARFLPAAMMIRSVGGRHRALSTIEAAAAAAGARPVKLAYVEYPAVPLDPATSSDAQQRALASAPPVVIVHGLLGSSTNWRTFVSRPTFAGRRVFGVDLRNHGNSPHSDDMRLTDLAADLSHFIAHLPAAHEGGREGRVALLGHSLGGKAAMLTALLHPDRVSRLVVADISPVNYAAHHSGWSGVTSVVRALSQVDLTQVHTRADADRMLTPGIPDKVVRQFALANLTPVSASDAAASAVGAQYATAPAQKWKWRVNLPVLQGALREFSTFPYDAFAASRGPYRGPTLFLGGAQSNYIQPAFHDTIYSLFPAARIEMVPRAGHWLHVERPAEVAQALDAFLKPNADADAGAASTAAL